MRGLLEKEYIRLSHQIPFLRRAICFLSLADASTRMTGAMNDGDRARSGPPKPKSNRAAQFFRYGNEQLCSPGQGGSARCSSMHVVVRAKNAMSGSGCEDGRA